MSTEEWAPIPGYPEYAVSDQGRVFGFPRTLIRERRPRDRYRNIVALRARYLAGWHTRGRIQVALGKKYSVCRLAMLAFVGECPEGYVVEHINGDNSDNRLKNLHYVPQGDVCLYGEDSPHAKFSNDQIARLRRLHASGQTNISALAREFDMSRRHVRRVLAEETRKRG